MGPEGVSCCNGNKLALERIECAINRGPYVLAVACPLIHSGMHAFIVHVFFMPGSDVCSLSSITFVALPYKLQDFYSSTAVFF